MIKICNNWNSFHNDIENIKSNVIKNAHLPFLIDKVIKKYLNYKFSTNPNQLKDTSLQFCKENFKIKLVFNSFKINNYFSYKDPIPDDLKSFPVYKFTCASCSSSYIEEHIKMDNKSHFLNIYIPW